MVVMVGKSTLKLAVTGNQLASVFILYCMHTTNHPRLLPSSTSASNQYPFAAIVVLRLLLACLHTGIGVCLGGWCGQRKRPNPAPAIVLVAL